MKIKIMKVINLVIVLTLLTGCSSDINSSKDEQTFCGVESCNNMVVKNDYGHGVYSYSKYCEEHICKEDSCGLMAQDNSDYCNIHTEKQITLSDEQLIEVKQIADDYISQLMSIHPNILAVNFINDTPELTTMYIQYRCNVVREDSDTNLATLYIYITDDGAFKVDRLEYDE